MTVSSLIAASAFASAHDVLSSPAVELARNLVLILAVVFWLGLAFWTYRDARRRTDEPLAFGTAAALGLAVPYVGPLIYLLFRPPETLGDVREREAGMRALGEGLAARSLHCPVCRVEVEEEFRVCPVCTTRLKHACTGCSAALEPAWQVCPYCTAPVALPAADLDAALTAEIAAKGEAAADSLPV